MTLFKTAFVATFCGGILCISAFPQWQAPNNFVPPRIGGEIGYPLTNNRASSDSDEFVRVSTAVVTRAPQPKVHEIISFNDYSGVDLCAKLNTDLRNISSDGAVIDARMVVGTQNCATRVNVPGKTTILLGPVTIIQSAPIILNENSASIVGVNGASIDINSFYGSTKFIQADGANLPYQVYMHGSFNALRDVYIDGNSSKNPTARDGVYVDSQNAVLSFVTILNAKRHGIFFDAPTANQAAGAKLLGVRVKFSGQDGLYSYNNADSYVTNSEFEASGSHAVELNCSPTWRWNSSDFGASSLSAFYAYGASCPGSLSSQGHILVGNQFGGNAQEDIYILGGSVYGSYNNIIVGNEFIGGSRTSNIYDSIYIRDSGGNVVNGNQFNSPFSNRLKYAIEIHETGLGIETRDNVGTNSYSGSYGTGTITSNSSSTAFIANGIDANNFAGVNTFTNSSDASTSNTGAIRVPNGGMWAIGHISSGAGFYMNQTKLADYSGTFHQLYDTFDNVVLSWSGPVANGGTATIGLDNKTTKFRDVDHSTTWATINSAGVNTTGVFSVNGRNGVSCNGAPTASFASVGGIITHC